MISTARKQCEINIFVNVKTEKLKFYLRLLLIVLLLNSCADQVSATGNRREALKQLRIAPKFRPDRSVMYPGPATENDRVRLEGTINKLIDNLLATNVESLDKQAVLKEFKTTLAKTVAEDTEDEDHVCFYLEKIMDIFQIESSDGLLNKWRYGFDPDKIKH